MSEYQSTPKQEQAWQASREAWHQHLDEAEADTGPIKVQIRLGPDGAHVAYRRARNLTEARALAERVPPNGMAGIWRRDRRVHSWYSRDADGKLSIVLMD